MNVDLSHKRILKIAIPMIAANATVPILGAVDTAVVGQMGSAALIGAVGIGAIIITGIYWIFGFLRMGTSGLVAQAKGAGDSPEISALLMRALAIGGAFGLFFIIFHKPLFWGAFFVSPASNQVETLAAEYLNTRIFSAPAAIMLFGITGWLIAMERTGMVLLLQLWMNGLNIALDILFVVGFNWGIVGVATASLIAEWSGLILGLWFVRDGFSQGHWNNWAQIFNRKKLINMAAVNGDILIRTVLLEFAFISFMFLGSDFDDVTLAVNQVLIQFLHITAYVMDGFVFAAETLVGQAYGAKNSTRIRRSTFLCFQWTSFCGVLMCLVFWFFGDQAVNIMTTATDVQAMGAVYLPWMIIAPVTGILAWTLDGIFIGATRTVDMRNMMLVSFVIYCLSIVSLVPLFGNHGLWAALNIFFIVRGITLAFKYPALERIFL